MLFGIAAKVIMKNKLMAKLGKTVAEEFMKRYGDDIRACKKMYYELMDELKNHKTQTAVAKSANPENTSFYVNQMNNGTSDETLCEIAENNAKGLKYPDELLLEMSDTKMADEMVTVVNKYGETATQLMEAYKDDAVKVLTEYGDDAFAIIKTYGDDVIPYLSKYGDDALEALEKGITKDQIDKLARQGIKPGEYAEKGIIDEATAKVVIGDGRINPRTYKEGFDKHLISGTMGKGQKGVVGGHNFDEFKKVLTDAGYDVDDCIVKINNHPTIDGIYEVEYRIPARTYGPNGDLVVIPGQYKTITYPKTVYDPSIISDTQMIQWGKEAMESGVVDGRKIMGYSSNGLKFEGYVDTSTGEITNFYPVLED